MHTSSGSAQLCRCSTVTASVALVNALACASPLCQKSCDWGTSAHHFVLPVCVNMYCLSTLTYTACTHHFVLQEELELVQCLYPSPATVTNMVGSFSVGM